MKAPLGRIEAPRVGSSITFDATEGRALEVLAILLGRARGAVVTAPAKFDTPRRELMAAGARRITRSVSQYLSLDGGYRERALLRDGRRASGRVWSPALGEGFAPKYTAASRTLWLAAAATLPTLSGLDATADAVRKASRTIATMVETGGTASGDWVFYAIAHESIRTFRLTASDEQTMQRRLREGSPLASLLYAESDAARDVLQGRFRKLVARDAVRVVECVEDRLARAWFRRASQVWTSRLSPEELTRRWSALGATTTA